MTTPYELSLIKDMNEQKLSANEILSQLDVISDISQKPNVTNALDLIVNPHKDTNRKVRKGTKRKSNAPEDCNRKCINCDQILTFAEHTCAKCAIVQEVDWLEMPTLDEMRFKYQTHSIPCAYKRINHFNVSPLLSFNSKIFYL